MAQAEHGARKAPAQRPLSPHLQIYGWTWTFVMSGFHRASGVALYFGIGLFALWLVMLSSGAESALFAYWFMGTPIGLLIVFGFTWGLMHHLFGGIRHFIWDAGCGFDAVTRRRMAIFTLAASVIATILIWAFALLTR